MSITEGAAEPEGEKPVQGMSTESPRKAKREKKKSKQKDDNGPRTIWDLLAPPPIYVLDDK
jgi:hypothetical protein